MGLGFPEGTEWSGARKIARLLRSISGGDVLDVGTGRGDFIETMAVFLADYTSFTGIDPDGEELEEAMERLEGMPVQLVAMDGVDMTFGDDRFDTVGISYSLHHLERVEDVLEEMRRVLRPGGAFILQEMFSDGEQTPAQETDIMVANWSTRIDRLLGKYHREMYTREEIRSFIDGLGLRDVTVVETARYVDCLTCEDRARCEDPLDPGTVKDRLEDIEDDLERLESIPDRELASALAEEGRAFIDRIGTVGTRPASIMFAVGRK